MFVQKAADLATFCAICWLLCLLTGGLHAALRCVGAGGCRQRRRSQSAGRGQGLAAIWPKMICRRVDKPDPSTSHPCFKNRICQICRNKFITYIILDFRLYYI